MGEGKEGEAARGGGGSCMRGVPHIIRQTNQAAIDTNCKLCPSRSRVSFKFKRQAAAVRRCRPQAASRVIQDAAQTFNAGGAELSTRD